MDRHEYEINQLINPKKDIVKSNSKHRDKIETLILGRNGISGESHVPDPYNGHEYVDLDLPSGTLWATMNVGATSETDYGLYFQWGDIQGYTAEQVGSGEGKKAFAWTDYKWTEDGGSTMSKYNKIDDKTILDLEDDAVAVNWGGSWKMPTETLFQELLDNTNSELTMINNVNGYKFTSKTDNSKYIFIPAAGYASNATMNSVDNYGYVFSSSVYSSNINYGCCLFCVGNNIKMSNSLRFNGRSVRGVID